MTLAVAILERLLSNDLAQNGKEHVIETISSRVENAHGRLEQNFDNLVKEISVSFDTSDCPRGASNWSKGKGALPTWLNKILISDGKPTPLRLSYWKRPEGMIYVALRQESDPLKERHPHYSLALGARRKDTLQNMPCLNKSRSGKEHWMSMLIPFFSNW